MFAIFYCTFANLVMTFHTTLGAVNTEEPL